MNLAIIFYILLGLFIGVPLYLFWRKKKTFYAYKKKIGTIGQILFIGGLVVLIVSPIAPFNDGWLWERWTGDTTPVIPTLGSHLDYNGESEWSGIDAVWNVQPALDKDGSNAAADVDSITWSIFSGDISSASMDMFLNNDLTLNEFLIDSSLSLLESGTAATGICTTTGNLLNSNQEYLIMLGLFNAAEDGASPMKSSFYKMVCQGANGQTKPSTVNMGLGLVLYEEFPDEDDFTIALVTDARAAVGATTLDWSDETDQIFDLAVQMTFANPEMSLSSYYDYANDRWYNWFVCMDFNQHNATGVTTLRALVPDSSGYTDGFDDNSDGLTYWIQLSNPIIHTSNNPTNDIGYQTNAAGIVSDGFGAVQWIDFSIDLSGVTKVGSVDDSQEFRLLIDFGTAYLISGMETSGAIPDNASTNNYHTAGAATYYVVV